MRQLIAISTCVVLLCAAVSAARAENLTILNGRTVILKQVAQVTTNPNDPNSAGLPINDATSPADGSGRMFVVAQNGTVRIIQNGSLVTTPYLLPSNFTNFVGGTDERGLLGLAFHPNFNNVGQPGYKKFYTFSSRTTTDDATFFNNTNYGGGNVEALGTDDGTYQNILTEWTLSPGTNTSSNTFNGTSRVVFSIAKQNTNHNGGGIAFGTGPGDTGNLYIALGDGGDSNDHSGGSNWASLTDGHTNNTGNAQDKNVAYGKILRVNPLEASPGGAPYTVPASNPFFGATAGLDEIYAYGFRNPFRLSFDPLTHELYTGDVGQGAREEVDRVVSGGNYGWVNREGSIATPGLTGGPSALVGTAIDPIAEYTHPSGGAVIGGFVNRGPDLFNQRGMYIFGELTRKLYFVDPGDPNEQIYQFGINFNGSSTLPSGINGFGRDADGHLYVLLSNGLVLAMLPEPSTGALAAVGLACGAAIALVRRRRARRAIGR